MQIATPYLMFLGDVPDTLAAKTAYGIKDWRPEWCVGQLRLPGCAADLGIPDLTLVEAVAKGCRTMVIGVANAGGVLPEHWVAEVVAALEAGLDIAGVVEVISQGAAGSWQMQNRHKSMAEGKFDFGFAVDWMRKDLSICLAEARRNGANLPVAALVDQFYAEVQKMGGSRWDTSALIARLDR